MSKIDLNDVNSGYNRSAINTNFQRIKDFLNDRVLMRNNVSGEPNTVENDINFNGKRIYNLPAPTSSSEPARLQDLNDVVASGAVLATSTNDGLLSRTDFSKLAGIDDNATANSPDAYLLERSNHTGTQAISTITSLQTTLNAKQDTLVSGTNIKTVNSTSLLGSGNINIAGVTSVAATVPSFLSVTGSPITTSGTLAIGLSGTALPVVNGGTGVTTSTGSGSNVLSTSPTLTTPIINGFTGDTSAINIGSGQFVKDTSGNVGIGITPSAWRSGDKTLDIGATTSLVNAQSVNTRLYNNAYVASGGINTYKTTDFATYYDQGSGIHRWFTAPSGTAGTAVTFTQVLAVEKDKSLALQGATSVTGAGISFPATQVSSSDVNTLDDYEEGTWTPNQGAGLTVGGTFSSAGVYTKVGRLVTVSGVLNATSSIAVAAGGIMTGNLPFVANVTGYSGQGVAMSSNYTSFGGAYAYNNSVYCIGGIAASTSIYFSATYYV